MCQWFSCVSDGKGKVYFFDQEQREKIRKEELFDGTVGNNLIEDADSHSSISTFFKLDDDLVNKYEYRPLDREFIIDQINVVDDRKKVLRKIYQLKFQKLAPPELILKPIVHPFKDRKAKKVTKKDIELLKKWYSVRGSVRYSVWDSVRGSVWDSVGVSVWDSVGDSVRGSVRYSVWYSAMDSVGDLVHAYISSFFNLKKWDYIDHPEWENPFQPAIDLWERGIIPAYDGKQWLLFGHKGELLKKVKI